jgi:protocatechuate 3,4-dioxygenase beta subunit
VLALVPEARRATLIGTAAPDKTIAWDVRLQGKQETVFFQF